jgi:hypothetical protein
MITLTKAVQQPISTEEKLALDTEQVCAELIQSLSSKDREKAVALAKVLMLKAMTM